MAEVRSDDEFGTVTPLIILHRPLSAEDTRLMLKHVKRKEEKTVCLAFVRLFLPTREHSNIHLSPD